MNSRHNRNPSPGWRQFLKRHDSNIWACDFFSVQTIFFETLYVFFVIRHVNREILHIAVTSYPTADRTAQQIVECCAWERWPPRFLIHDRDGRYGVRFDCRMRHLGIKQVRTPFRAPPSELNRGDHLFVFNEAHLRRVMSAYIGYFNHWRPHRSLGQRAPCDSSARRPRSPEACGRIVAEPILGALHHIYKPAE
jgi:putative transposase